MFREGKKPKNESNRSRFRVIGPDNKTLSVRAINAQDAIWQSCWKLSEIRAVDILMGERFVRVYVPLGDVK